MKPKLTEAFPLAGFAFIKMGGSFASFAGSALIGELHHATGNFAAPVFLLASLMTVGAVLAITFKEPGRLPPVALFIIGGLTGNGSRSAC